MKKLLIIIAAAFTFAAGSAQAGEFSEQDVLNFVYAYETALAYTAGGSVEYIGRAAAGTAATEAGWQIQKITYTAGAVTSVTFADNTPKFIKVWNDRAGYAY